MKDTITVRKEHAKFILGQLPDCLVKHEIINVLPEHVEIEVEFSSIEQITSAFFLGGMLYANDFALSVFNPKVKNRPFSESELTQL